jgi:hypothetical protein
MTIFEEGVIPEKVLIDLNSKIKRVDNSPIPNNKDEIRLFAIARNEALRLPFFLEYYFKLGVDRIFLIDNQSLDETVSIALTRKKVHVFVANDSFKNFSQWKDFLLELYGKDYWCLVVDIDELFYYPLADKLGIKTFVKYLDKHGFTATENILLDIYSSSSVANTSYLPNENPLNVLRYFDKQIKVGEINQFDHKNLVSFRCRSYFGGVRHRVFSRVENKLWLFCLSKYQLFKYTSIIYLTGGQHAINNAKLADLRGVVLHTKFLYDFVEKVKNEVYREVHSNGAMEYKFYYYHLAKTPHLRLKNKYSSKLKKLAKFDIMRMSTTFIQWSKTQFMIGRLCKRNKDQKNPLLSLKYLKK